MKVCPGDRAICVAVAVVALAHRTFAVFAKGAWIVATFRLGFAANRVAETVTAVHVPGVDAVEVVEGTTVTVDDPLGLGTSGSGAEETHSRLTA